MSLFQNDHVLFLGIDGGGSKCQAQIADAEGRLLGSGRSGPANPAQGFEQSIASVCEAATLAIADTGLQGLQLSDLVAGVGLAGVNLPGIYQSVAQWQHPFGAMYLTTDLEIACLGAHKGDDGAVIISGTGSCGFSRVGNKSMTIGGHGFTFGDLGSGAWTGLEAVKAALLAIDNMGPATSLSVMIEGELGVQGLSVVERLTGQPSYSFAKLAPLVLKAAEQGDEVAIAILRKGGTYLSELADKLMSLNAPRLSMIGGFSLPMTKWMDHSIVAQLSPALESPEIGAIHYARRCHQRRQAEQADG